MPPSSVFAGRALYGQVRRRDRIAGHWSAHVISVGLDFLLGNTSAYLTITLSCSWHF
jgi:hypothetical protein